VYDITVDGCAALPWGKDADDWSEHVDVAIDLASKPSELLGLSGGIAPIDGLIGSEKLGQDSGRDPVMPTEQWPGGAAIKADSCCFDLRDHGQISGEIVSSFRRQAMQK
jgi:hypothetical protein